jgi:predicted RNA-binding Zn-ribbon protein involved in translation (DUF1610 family)
MPLLKRLYIDIETSPMTALIFRIGQKISIGHENIIDDGRISVIGYKWEGKEVKAMTWKHGCDKELLKAFVPILMQADEVIAHNGDRFDLPLIRARCLFHRIPIPAQLPSVDTLKQARKGFLFPSRRLDFLGKHMGHEGKRQHSGFDLWKRVHFGDRKALREMVEYCKRDVELLENVHRTLSPYVTPAQHLAIVAGGIYKHHCPECGSDHVVRNGSRRVSALGSVKQQMQCKDCQRFYLVNERVLEKELRHIDKIKKLEELKRKKLADQKRKVL